MNAFECPFSYHNRKNPSQIAIKTSKESLTYQNCHDLIETIAMNLKKLGVKPKEKVALYPTASFSSVLLFFALFRLEAIVCPINTYIPLSKLSETLDEFHATFFLFPDALKNDLPPLKQITSPFKPLLTSQNKQRFGEYFLNKETPATYLMTSGTSKRPKIVCHALSNHYYSALGSNRYIPLAPSDSYLLSLPLYHVAGIGILFRTFLAGATLLLSDEKAHDSKTLTALDLTHLSFVPTQLQRLMEQASIRDIRTLSSKLKCILLGGATISPQLYQKAKALDLPIYPTYGMTEMSSQICTKLPSSMTSFSLGHPLPFRELVITSQREILVRGKTLFLGYLDENHHLHLPLTPEGYFATGDLGTYAPKTGLHLLGRKDRLFISGGENIYPEEIENHLREVDGIIDVRIEAKEDQEFGMRPVAYIESKRSFREGELQEYLQTFLPKYKVPIAFHATPNELSTSMKSRIAK